MAHPFHHAESSVRKFGGKIEDYIAIHAWFDASKEQMANFRHRALRHHALGIFQAEREFGVTIRNSDGRDIPTRFIGEQHVREDCGGRVPSLQDWLKGIPAQRWMSVGDLSSDSFEVSELSVEAWRDAVANGETILGFSEWVQRFQKVVKDT